MRYQFLVVYVSSHSRSVEGKEW